MFIEDYGLWVEVVRFDSELSEVDRKSYKLKEFEIDQHIDFSWNTDILVSQNGFRIAEACLTINPHELSLRYPGGTTTEIFRLDIKPLWISKWLEQCALHVYTYSIMGLYLIRT